MYLINTVGFYNVFFLVCFSSPRHSNSYKDILSQQSSRFALPMDMRELECKLMWLSHLTAKVLVIIETKYKSVLMTRLCLKTARVRPPFQNPTYKFLIVIRLCEKTTYF